MVDFEDEDEKGCNREVVEKSRYRMARDTACWVTTSSTSLLVFLTEAVAVHKADNHVILSGFTQIGQCSPRLSCLHAWVFDCMLLALLLCLSGCTDMHPLLQIQPDDFLLGITGQR